MAMAITASEKKGLFVAIVQEAENRQRRLLASSFGTEGVMAPVLSPPAAPSRSSSNASNGVQRGPEGE